MNWFNLEMQRKLIFCRSRNACTGDSLRTPQTLSSLKLLKNAYILNFFLQFLRQFIFLWKLRRIQKLDSNFDFKIFLYFSSDRDDYCVIRYAQGAAGDGIKRLDWNFHCMMYNV